MPTTDILKTLGLRHNPFTDRTAEKTEIDPLCVLRHYPWHTANLCMHALCVLQTCLLVAKE